MRRAHIGWVGAGVTALVGLAALEACGSKGTGGSTGTSSSGTASGTGGATSSAGSTSGSTSSASGSSSSTGGVGGATTSSSSTGGGATTSSSSSSSSSGNPAAGESVLMHHKNLNRDGLYVQPALTKAAVATLHKDPGFVTSGIQGLVYAQPLFVDGGVGGQDLVLVATEQNNVYALDAATGATVWVSSLGAPVPLATLPCGNIDPFGVTGTPVIDLASRTLFVDAEVIPSGGTATHRVYGISIDTGTVKPGWPVDMPTKAKSGATTFIANVQGQRGALAVLGGTVYVPFGGRFGDCGNYHGWVVAISIADPTSVQSWVTTAHAGGVWAPGGIASDGTSLFVATGNTQSTTTWGGGDAVIRLAPGAPPTMSAYFAPKNWLALDNGDLDLGTAPLIFDLPGSTPSALALAFGKDGDAYLLDRNNLGGVGAALGASPACSTTGNCFSLHVSTAEVISAPVVYTTATATYVATRGPGATCTNGGVGSSDLFTIQVMPGSPPTLKAAWCGLGGSGSPMVTTSDGHADAIVWTLGAEGDGRLHAFDGDTGAPIPFTSSAAMVPGMRRYNTPIAAKGRIYVPVDGASGGVVAFTL